MWSQAADAAKQELGKRVPSTLIAAVWVATVTTVTATITAHAAAARYEGGRYRLTQPP